MRKLNRNRVFGLLIFLSLSATSFSQEMRMALKLPLYTYKNFSFESEVQTRMSYNKNAFTNTNMATISTEYDLSKRFEIGGSYRIISNPTVRENNEKLKLLNEENYRATIDFTFKTPRINKYRLKNKLRFQLSDFDEKKQKRFIRNKLLLDYKISKDLNINYGIETIYRVEKHKISCIRLHMGNTLNILNHDFTGFFIIENKFKSNPVNLNYIVGVKLKI